MRSAFDSNMPKRNPVNRREFVRRTVVIGHLRHLLHTLGVVLIHLNVIVGVNCSLLTLVNAFSAMNALSRAVEGESTLKAFQRSTPITGIIRGQNRRSASGSSFGMNAKPGF